MCVAQCEPHKVLNDPQTFAHAIGGRIDDSNRGCLFGRCVAINVDLKFDRHCLAEWLVPRPTESHCLDADTEFPQELADR